MTLTAENLQALKRPFAANEHEFKQDKVYLTEEAITDRLDEVDPSWTFTKLSMDIREKQAVAIFRLTVCGVERDGVGMGDINTTKDGSREVNEAEKSAATDALKRAARLFGIGRYILTIPKWVSDMTTLEKWINGSTQPQQQGNNKPATPKQNGNADKVAIDPVTVEKVVAANGKPFWVFRDANKQSATTWSISPLKALGFEIDAEAAPGKQFDVTGITVYATVNGKYLNVGENDIVRKQDVPF